MKTRALQFLNKGTFPTSLVKLEIRNLEQKGGWLEATKRGRERKTFMVKFFLLLLSV